MKKKRTHVAQAFKLYDFFPNVLELLADLSRKGKPNDTSKDRASGTWLSALQVRTMADSGLGW